MYCEISGLCLLLSCPLMISSTTCFAALCCTACAVALQGQPSKFVSQAGKFPAFVMFMQQYTAARFVVFSFLSSRAQLSCFPCSIT
jgi:hypothetical protein